MSTVLCTTRLRVVAVVLGVLLSLVAALALPRISYAAAATPFSGDFEDGTTAGWSKSGGTWTVTSDGTRVVTQSKVTAEPSRLFAGDTHATDYSVQARVKPLGFSSPTGLVGIVGRSAGPTSFLRLAVLGSGKAQLQAVRGGAVTVLGTSAGSFATGSFHTLRLELAGSSVRGLVDGAPVASGTTTVPAGRIGLQTAGGTASFDDVTVDDIVATPPTTTPPTTTSPTTTPPTTTPPTTTPPRSAPPTTTPPGASPSPTAPWPTPTGNVRATTTIKVTGNFDGGLKRFAGIGDGSQSESQPPMFELSGGATLANVIIGAPAGDGVHCLGSCTLTNVWWEDVGEDAATFLGTSASQTMTVDGGGARSASDKVFQHNGPGTFVIKNFQVSDFGKLYRACGNCSAAFKRDVVIDNIVATAPGKAIAGINTNFGDVARISRVVIVGDPSKKIKVCDKFRGVGKGSEPPEIGSGPDGTNCLYRDSDVTYR